MNETDATKLVDLMRVSKPGGEKDMELYNFYGPFTKALMSGGGSFSNDDGKSFVVEVDDDNKLHLTLGDYGKEPITFTPIEGGTEYQWFHPISRQRFGFEDSEYGIYSFSYKKSNNDVDEPREGETAAYRADVRRIHKSASPWLWQFQRCRREELPCRSN
eukprot:GHVS01035129.1.p1 GENE.GHVS01035129.1~~GHVS01035129.1.p1  ORF type:complete len:160 (-),score=17.60 GHVS01035129.1:425-904(-)